MACALGISNPRTNTGMLQVIAWQERGSGAMAFSLCELMLCRQLQGPGMERPTDPGAVAVAETLAHPLAGGGQLVQILSLIHI